MKGLTFSLAQNHNQLQLLDYLILFKFENLIKCIMRTPHSPSSKADLPYSRISKGE
jgi:hypothetical protein